MCHFMGLEKLITFFLQQNGEVDGKHLTKEHFQPLALVFMKT